MSDHYDTMSDDEIRRQAVVRGIPKYKTDLFVGNALRDYMRDWDYDMQRREETDPSRESW